MTAPMTKMFEATNGELPRELVPQQRMGNEEELAGTIIYLASKVCRCRCPSPHNSLKPQEDRSTAKTSLH